MQSYDEAINSASEIIANAMIKQLEQVTEHGLNLDDQITEIMRPVAHNVEEMVLQAAHSMLLDRYQQQGWKVERHPTVPFKTLHGEIRIKSPYLKKEDEVKGLRPMLLHFGVRGRGMSLNLERTLCSFGAEKSFPKAAKLFTEHYGQTIDITTLQRHTEAMGEHAESWLDDRYQHANNEQLQEASEVISELDGCEIRTGLFSDDRKTREIKWKECRTGVVHVLGSLDSLYVCANAPYSELCDNILACTDLCGRTRETRIIAPGDGAQGLMETMVETIPNLKYILDHRHLESHFYETAQELGYTDRARELWVRRHMGGLWANDYERIHESLANEYQHTKNDRLRCLINHLDRFSACVDYGYCRKLGWPVGSGEVESANRYIPQERMKIPGATWHPDHLNPMLALRVVRACDWWNQFWQWKSDHLRVSIPKAA
ncbi:MAG: hypothetical protein OXC41_00105 [Gammaproteobacteria bacterium]|nr:hypothetical protein [Gammaproteobacteria bacterium]